MTAATRVEKSGTDAAVSTMVDSMVGAGRGVTTSRSRVPELQKVVDRDTMTALSIRKLL